MMRKIYSHPDMAIVQLVKNELENRGIKSVIRGEHLAAVAGGGASMDAWFELWVMEDERLQETARVVQEFIEHDDVEGAEPWRCPDCGEKIEPQFAVCWNCGRARPEEETM